MAFVRVLYYIIECTMLTAAGPGLIGAKLDLKKILLIGFLHGLSLWGVRTVYLSFGIPFGTHTIFLALILFLLLWRLAGVDWFLALCGTLISFILLMLGEQLLIVPLFKAYNLSYSLSESSVFWLFVFGLGGDCLLILVILINLLKSNRMKICR